jgi:hypothetical protein
MEILLTLPSGNIRSVFSDRVLNYETLPDRSPNSKVAGIIRFLLHGGYCGGHGNPLFSRKRRLTATLFGFKMPE